MDPVYNGEGSLSSRSAALVSWLAGLIPLAARSKAVISALTDGNDGPESSLEINAGSLTAAKAFGSLVATGGLTLPHPPNPPGAVAAARPARTWRRAGLRPAAQALHGCLDEPARQPAADQQHQDEHRHHEQFRRHEGSRSW